MTHRNKQSALIAAGEAGHRIAILSDRVFGPLTDGDISREDAEIKLYRFPQDYERLESLEKYTLIILDYETFSGHEHLQQPFAKQMFGALNAGVNFCFVHYDSPVLPQGVSSKGDSRAVGLYLKQIGLQTLFDHREILPYRTEIAFNFGKVRRDEFKVFLDRWGVSHLFFQPEAPFDQVIYQTGQNNLVLAFAYTSGRGKVIFLPFLREFQKKENLISGINTLIDSVLTYISKSLADLPVWAEKAPFFSDERDLMARREKLESELKKVDSKLQTFGGAKAMLFQQEYTLGDTVPRFIKTDLKINTEKNETHNEDFWILNNEGEKVVVAEVKSKAKGFNKSMIYDLYNHREANNLDESFPALLVTNCNLQAGSWKDKDVGIPPRERKIAAEDNILIVRVEDLVRLWDALRLGKITSETILSLFLTSKGWLSVLPDLSWKVYES